MNAKPLKNLDFTFKPVNISQRGLVHKWLMEPHVAEWYYGQGLENTLDRLDEFLDGSTASQYWIAYEKKHPIAFLITSYVQKPSDTYKRWCAAEGSTITLDILIGDTDYLGKGLAPFLIQEFLLNQFPCVDEVLIDPEATNTRAIHVYQKVGFKILGEFIPSHNPNPHLMMRLNMREFKLKGIQVRVR